MERIWIYTLSRQLEPAQLIDFTDRCRAFTGSWTAHDISLDASFELYHNRLLIFKVNEANYNASGCSIDKQLRFVKELEQVFSLELLNRLLVAYEKNNEVLVVKQSQIPDLLASKEIDEDTLIFNNTISQSTDLANNWKQPLRNTWLTKYLITLKP